MSLYKHGNVWHSCVWIDGVRYRKSTNTANRRQAEIIDRQHKEELNLARHRVMQIKRDMTVGELSALFIAEGMARPYAEERLTQLTPFFADVPLLDITPGLIRRYRDHRHAKGKLTVATVNRDLSVLRRILNWGVDEGYLVMNPLGRLRMERERRTKRPVLSLREEHKLMAAAPPHLQQITQCALLTGMRRGEILQQRWADMDRDNHLLYVSHSKTPEGEMREIPLSKMLFELLAPRWQTDGMVLTYHKAPLKRIKTSWAATLRRSGIRHFRFHDLRHCFNTRLMLAGVSQDVRKVLMGHSSGSRETNDRYTQVELPVKQDAIHKLELWLAAQELLLEQEPEETATAPSPEMVPQLR